MTEEPADIPSSEPVAPAEGSARRSLKSRAVRASVITVGGYATSQLIRIGSNMALTRLLFPEAFGLMALVQVLLTGLEMVSDIGIQPSIIQHRRGDEPSFLNTAWTLQVIRGLVLWVCGLLLAAPFAWFYEEPQLAQLVPVVTLSAVLAGFNSTKLAILNRRVVIGPMVAIDLCAQIVAVVVMISAALVYRSVWALVAGGLVSSLTKMLLSHLAIGGVRNRLQWDSAASREIVRFGKWIFVSTLISFLAMRLDIFLLGRLVPMELLGIYSIAGLLAVLPQQVTNRLAVTVLFPTLAAAARESREMFSSNLRRARSILLPAAMLCVLSIGLLSPQFFYYLYDERYHSAGWMAQLLSFSVWFFLLHLLASRTLLALGDSRALAIGNAIRLAFSALGCVAGFQWAGLAGLILGIALGSLAGYLSLMVAMLRHGLSIGPEDLRYTVAGAMFGMIGAASPQLIAGLVPFEDLHLLGLLCSGVVLAPVGLFTAYRARHLSTSTS